MKIKGARNKNADIDDDLISASNFFPHLIKEINITRYGNDKQLKPTFSPYEIYQYSNAMLKHLPEKTLKNKKTMLYSSKIVSCNKTTIDRRTYNSTTPADITDDNLDNKVNEFQNQIKNENVYRIPLRKTSEKLIFCSK